MKKSIFTFLLFLFAVVLMAQVPAGFSYQAVVRNNSGEIVANKTVKFRFSIFQSSLSSTPVYVETHSVSTNAFGLANLNVGTGNPISGSLSPSLWGEGDGRHFLKVEIDPENGDNFSHIGTVQLMSVPYAFHAQTVELLSDNSVTTKKIFDGAVTGAKIAQSGATSGQVLKWNGNTWAPGTDLTEGDVSWAASGSNMYYNSGNIGIGTSSPAALLHTHGTNTGQGNVLFNGQYKASNPGNPPATGLGTRMMWYPDRAAFRAGYVNGTQWDKASVGDYSVAMGFATTASGSQSVALGSNSAASGEVATSMGYTTAASGKYATAMGVSSKATGEASTALGVGSQASGYASATMGFYTTSSTLAGLAIGRYNVGGGSATSWIATDPLFEIGIGSSASAKNNAFTVLKNGRVGIGTASPRQQLSVGDFLDIYSGFVNTPTRPSIRASSNNNLIINAHDQGILYFNLEGGTGETRFYKGAGTEELLHISANGNVGIGTGAPQELLHVRSTTGTSKMRVQSIDRSAIEFYDNTKYRGAVGFDNFNGYLYLKSGGDVVLRDGKVGIGTVNPTATLDVNGSVKIGPAGSVIMEIREITGNLNSDGYLYMPYPSGYNVINTRVLSCQIWVNISADIQYWRDIEHCELRTTRIFLYDNAGPVNFRLILMKMY